MLTKTFTYTDYNGVERTEEHHFGLTKSELMIMNLSQYGGLEKHLSSIAKANDLPTLLENFRMIIRKSYGEISPDGRRFIKSDELSDAFEQTEAYNQLFMELVTDENATAAFARGILPADLVKEADKALKENPNIIDMPVASTT